MKRVGFILAFVIGVPVYLTSCTPLDLFGTTDDPYSGPSASQLAALAETTADALNSAADEAVARIQEQADVARMAGDIASADMADDIAVQLREVTTTTLDAFDKAAATFSEATNTMTDPDLNPGEKIEAVAVQVAPWLPGPIGGIVSLLASTGLLGGWWRSARRGAESRDLAEARGEAGTAIYEAAASIVATIDTFKHKLLPADAKAFRDDLAENQTPAARMLVSAVKGKTVLPEMTVLNGG